MEELSKLPNIGKTLAEKLVLIGIENASQLRNTGTENVFIRLKTVDKDACINMLCAIEGAILGIRWHDLEKVRKEELKAFFRMTNIS
ncbi:MAG TPA: competence protein TfoX [Saprospirales bacterium]|nr:competence protein TfoX [Saprospirales bacterium]